ncbi:MAG: signal peptidase [Paenibacillaceae bacterium]|nr:signal peptidase [Paenibacillaceae bacterium]
MTVKRVGSWTVNVILVVLFIVMAGSVALSRISGGEPALFGYQLKVVLSGSMEPGIRTGSLIAVKPQQDMNGLKAGQIITFRQSSNGSEIRITHRIMEALEQADGQTLYMTKGDNNQNPDSEPVTPDQVEAIYSG